MSWTLTTQTRTVEESALPGRPRSLRELDAEAAPLLAPFANDIDLARMSRGKHPQRRFRRAKRSGGGRADDTSTGGNGVRAGVRADQPLYEGGPNAFLGLQQRNARARLVHTRSFVDPTRNFPTRSLRTIR